MWMDRLERKIGRFAIPNLMRYIIFANVIVYFISLIQPYIIVQLALIPAYVKQGQVWRLLTFIFVPPLGSNILLTALSLFCYYWIGGALERTWGAFRFNLYYFSGIIATIIASFIMDTAALPSYVNQTLFLALATLYPDTQILMMYIIPLKAKWAGVLSAVLMLVQFIQGSMETRGLMIAALAGYIIFFLPILIRNLRNMGRRQAYEKATRPKNKATGWAAGSAKKATSKRDSDAGKVIRGVAFHRCHICGITELDDPDMTFRYCSSCNGNYEYCENHLYNHEHVK